MQISTTPDGPRTKKGGPPACYLERYAVSFFPFSLPFICFSLTIYMRLSSLDVTTRIFINSATCLFPGDGCKITDGTMTSFCCINTSSKRTFKWLHVTSRVLISWYQLNLTLYGFEFMTLTLRWFLMTDHTYLKAICPLRWMKIKSMKISIVYSRILC